MRVTSDITKAFQPELQNQSTLLGENNLNIMDVFENLNNYRKTK